MFNDHVAALPSCFDNVAIGATEVCEPKIQFIDLPCRTLKTGEEIDVWATDVKGQLIAILTKGLVSIK